MWHHLVVLAPLSRPIWGAGAQTACTGMKSLALRFLLVISDLHFSTFVNQEKVFLPPLPPVGICLCPA